MRLPRDVSGDDLIRRLRKFNYEPTRQAGSHVRLSRTVAGAQYHITIPRHKTLRVGTLNSILNEVAEQLEMSKDQLLSQLF